MATNQLTFEKFPPPPTLYGAVSLYPMYRVLEILMINGRGQAVEKPQMWAKMAVPRRPLARHSSAPSDPSISTSPHLRLVQEVKLR